MADLEAEIAALQAEIDKRKNEVECLRQEAQPDWDDDEYSEESYYEDEIIEEYSEDEWEEEIIEEEIFEEEIMDDDYEEVLEEDEIMAEEYAPAPVNNISPSATPSQQQAQQQYTAEPPSASAPLVTRRPWTPSAARQQQPATTPEPAPTTAPKWKRPSSVPAPPPPAAQSSAPAWATKQQTKIKKTAVPVITAAGASRPTATDVSPQPDTASSAITAPSVSSGGKPVPRNKAKVRPPPGADGAAPVKNAPPPGLEVDAKPKGPRIRIIDWGANRRTNTAIQTAVQPNFKPGVPGATTSNEPEKVKRNYVIPKNIKPPPGADGSTGAPAPAASGGHKRRPIPDIPISPAGEETIWEQLLGPKLIANTKLQKKNTIGCMKDQELIGLYFGCKMKSECKFFHPRLQDFYFSASSKQQNLEIVYVSSDRSLMEFKDVFAKMPYLALPGGTASYKNKLSQSLKVIDQPTLVILDDEGMVVTVDAVNQIMSLERGNVEQANELVDRWKRTRPVTMDQVQRDFALQHGKLQRGVLYWQE